jgi:hypothetical protein
MREENAMKRIFVISLIVLMLALSVAGPALAQKGKVNINGKVTAVDDNTLTILSKKGETFVVTVPEGFITGSIQVGDSVLVKAVAGEDGAWIAQSIKEIGPGIANDDTGDDLAEGSKYNSAYCADGKQEKPHPFATRMAERYGVDEEWVMGYFCAGHGMGAIMLALKTSQMDGVNVDPETLLAERESGNGWGQIWQEYKLIGKEKEAHSPPGLLKKPDFAGPKDKDQ